MLLLGLPVPKAVMGEGEGVIDWIMVCKRGRFTNPTGGFLAGGLVGGLAPCLVAPCLFLWVPGVEIKRSSKRNRTQVNAGRQCRQYKHKKDTQN